MEFFANFGYGVILLVFCGVGIMFLYFLQKRHPLFNRALGYFSICLGIAIIMILGRNNWQLSDDLAFKIGLVFMLFGAALLIKTSF